ncbi:MAG: DUF58 domain-containing protein [Actinomycetota bacterium]|nr:DUF58 domain-containing protein [Actinomycetota bacterium]
MTTRPTAPVAASANGDAPPPTVADAARRVAAPARAERLLGRLEWQVVRRLDGILQGNHRSASRGIGVDVADLREYTATDDVRHIDWNVTARMDTPYVREFLEDREVTAWLVADRTASMTIGPPQRTKGDVLVDVTTVLARMLTRSGNRVGAVVWDAAAPRVVPASGGRDHVLRITHELLRPSPEPTGATDLGAVLRLARDTIRRRSVVVVLSDFITEPGWEQVLGQLAERHDVVAVRFSDPAESVIPDVGLLAVEDAETGDQVLVDTSEAGFRRRYHAEVVAREQAILTGTRSAGVHLHDVSTADDLVDALVALVATTAYRRR